MQPLPQHGGCWQDGRTTPGPAIGIGIAMSVDTVDSSFLETLVGYNARRASLAVIGVFLERMAPFGLKPVDFSVLSLVHHNPGITSRQVCTTLGILPPNLVAMIGDLEQRRLLRRERHKADGRAMSLYLTDSASAMIVEAQATAQALEIEATAGLTHTERQRLIQLLQKVYRN